MNTPDEELWEVFQTVYEPGSRTSLASAERDQPDIIDGVRVVAEWARKAALEEAAAVLRGEGEPGHAGEFISVNHAQELVSDLLAVTPNTDTKTGERR